jgi:hypothetical protein
MRIQNATRRTVSSASIQGSASAGEPDQGGGQCGREQKSQDGDDLAGDADIVDDKLGAGGDEAAGDLGDERPNSARKV